MHILPNGCKCSKLVVSPRDWDKGKVPKDCRIIYRFYDNLNGTRQVSIKNFNHIKDIPTRRKIIKELVDNEMYMLTKEAYNPITKAIQPIDEKRGIIDGDTPFIKAWLRALELIKVEDKTRKDIKNIIEPCRKAAVKLNIENTPIKEINKRHIKMILQQCAENSPRFSANTFNHYRKYLSILYTELNELEVIDHDPITKIKKQKTVQKMRQTLTAAEREKVKEHLKRYPAFHRFVQIFFHSGARISELLTLKVKDVNLKAQQYRCTIKKGKQYREVQRTIKDIALPYWSELLQGSTGEQHVFGKGLKPGTFAIRPDQITKRWKRLIKEPLKIDADFYALKHLATTETIDNLGEQLAAMHNAHTSTKMNAKIYDINRNKREGERIRKATNEF